ncbi:unnamed protein product [Phytophthora fragariaefolia]|uniref:Unnamed protein product n=1 Tax=Phytophthora fragariaefolia TaxID=1490495 RepID=A0A9W6YB84_9STRA|nr:unnamed protein product [Phytophthora fragariaefolia]
MSSTKAQDVAEQGQERHSVVDCLAPDREGHTGCPTTFTGRKRNAASNFMKTSSESSLEKRVKPLENSTNALEEKMIGAYSLVGLS